MFPAVQVLYAPGVPHQQFVCNSYASPATRDRDLRLPRCKLSTPPVSHVGNSCTFQLHVIELCVPRGASSLHLRCSTPTHRVLLKLHAIKLCVPRGASSLRLRRSTSIRRVLSQLHAAELCVPRDASSLRLRHFASTHRVLSQLHVIEFCVFRGTSSLRRLRRFTSTHVYYLSYTGSSSGSPAVQTLYASGVPHRPIVYFLSYM